MFFAPRNFVIQFIFTGGCIMKDLWLYIIEHLDIYFPLMINLIVALIAFFIGRLSNFIDKNNAFYLIRYEELLNPFFLIVDKYNNRGGRKPFSEYTDEDVCKIFGILMEKGIYADTLMRAIIDKICILDNTIQENSYQDENHKKEDILELNKSFELLYQIFLEEFNIVQMKLIWTRFQRRKNRIFQKKMIKKYTIEFEKSNNQGLVEPCKNKL